MVVAFCGHSDYVENGNDEEIVIELLERIAVGTEIEFFLGGYGSFDDFAYKCAKRFKERHTYARLVFITPYPSDEYLRRKLEYTKDQFDLIVYPEIENAPIKYAISHRNRWIADKADVVIAYVMRKYGGAYLTYKRARSKGKTVYNLAVLLDKA